MSKKIDANILFELFTLATYAEADLDRGCKNSCFLVDAKSSLRRLRERIWSASQLEPAALSAPELAKFVNTIFDDEPSVAPRPKRRGRPPGSKNKKRKRSTLTRRPREPRIHPRSQKVPFGYKDSNGKLVVDERQTPYITAMKDLRRRGHTYRSIADTVLQILKRSDIDVALAHSTVRNIVLDKHPLVR